MKTKILAILVTIAFICSCEGPQGPTGLSGADGLTDPNVKPKVIWTYPSNGQVGPITNLGNSIIIRFNKIMDISTLNRSLELLPSQTGYAWIDTNYTQLHNGDVAYIYVQSDSTAIWEIGQNYSFTVLSTLKDINGNSLPSPYSFSFTPEPYFRVAYTNPQNGSTKVPRQNQIIIGFNNRINFQSFQSSVSCSPLIPGNWVLNWYNDAILYPTSELNPNTEYIITINTEMLDAQGRALPSTYSFSFTTGP
jgi:hypothetical protein